MCVHRVGSGYLWYHVLSRRGKYIWYQLPSGVGMSGGGYVRGGRVCPEAGVSTPPPKLEPREGGDPPTPAGTWDMRYS